MLFPRQTVRLREAEERARNAGCLGKLDLAQNDSTLFFHWFVTRPWVNRLIFPHLYAPFFTGLCLVSQQLVPSKHSLCVPRRSSNETHRRNTTLRYCYCPLSHIDYAHCLFLELLIIIMICKFAADHSNWSNNISQVNALDLFYSTFSNDYLINIFP